MKEKDDDTATLSLRIKPYLITLFIVWTLLIVLSLITEIYQHRNNAIEVAKLENMATYNKDLAYRRWAASHGGVYVPITEITPSNPHLNHIKERDIATPSGRKLTLVNPAYMTRQVFELSKEQYGIRAHITSLKPINPYNAADQWETEALKSFESGAKDAVKVSKINGEPYMRLMMPMVVEKSCMKCHEKQGYKVGDIRGGISVSTPLNSHFKIARESSYAASTQHFIIWIIGLLGLSFGGKRFKKQLDKQKEVENELQELNKELEQRVAKEVEQSREKDQVMFEQSRHIAMAELLVNLAHQWRQPICAIGTIAQDIEDAHDYNELSADYLKNSVKLITGEVKDLSETINEFRSFFTKELHVSEFRVKESIEKALRMAENSVHQQHAHVEVKNIDDVTVVGYSNEFSQAIYNIIVNSLDVAEEREVKECTIAIVISKKKNAHIEITDNCGGVETAILEKIFDPYYTTRSKVRGKGIGLFMSKTIIENNMRGSLRFENVQDGARFIIEV